MKKKLRKIICTVISAVMIMGIAIPVYADRTPFNITIPYDTLSPKTWKADDEQKFYVTGHTFDNPIGVLQCYSLNYNNKNINSDQTGISQKYPRGSAYYRTHAPYGELYYMLTYSENATDFNVTGYYTP